MVTWLVVLAGLVAAPIAALAGAAVARRRGRREAGRRTQVLVETVCAALGSIEDTAAADAAVQRLAAAVHGDAGGLGIVEGDRLSVRGMWGLRAATRDRGLARGEGVAGRVWATGRPRVLDDLREEPTHVPDAEGMRSAVYVPGVSQGRVAVVLGFESRRRAAFTDDHVRLLLPIADLLAAVVDSRGRLRAADRLEERLLTSVGAELRSPLATVAANLTTLEHHGDRLGPDAAAELVEAGRRAAGRMQRLLDSLMLAGRLETGDVEFVLEPVGVGRVVAEAVEQVRAELGAADVAFEPGVLTAPEVLADVRHLRAVLVELVGNAVRHGDGALVSVDAAVEDGAVAVTVRDAGPGIPTRLLDAVLDGLDRPAADQVGERRGLGLYLAARLTEGMHGTLALRSRPGHGTAAVVRLPAAASPSPSR
jgi:K+-sensing histidine kinase KdpD